VRFGFEKEVNPFIFFFNFDAFVMCIVFQDYLFQKKERSFMISFLSHLKNFGEKKKYSYLLGPSRSKYVE